MTVGVLVKQLRNSRRVSQLQLAVAANISSRHLSFVENGRSKPSRGTLMALAEAMQLNARDTNLLFYSANEKPPYPALDLLHESMAPVRHALDRILRGHLPYPALVMDHDWNLLQANATYLGMIEMMKAQQSNWPDTDNVLQQLFDPAAVRPFVENWPEAAAFLLRRRQREESLSLGSAPSLLQTLLSYPDLPDWQRPSEPDPEWPMVSLQVRFGEQTLSLFSTLATFGSAVDVNLQSLRIEAYFPLDDATEQFFEPAS